MKRRVARGWSLTEVLTTTLVIAMLASIGIPQFSRHSLKAREKQLKADLLMVRNAMERAYADTGMYPNPDALDDVVAPSGGWVPMFPLPQGWTWTPMIASRWRGPYLKKLPTCDPHFTLNGEGGGYINGFTWNSGRLGSTITQEAFGAPSLNLSTEGTPYNTW